MSRTVLIGGTHAALVPSLAARLLAATGDRVVLTDTGGADLDHRRDLVRDGVDEVWCLPAGPGGSAPARAMRTDAATTRGLLAAAQSLGAKRFWYIGPAPTPGGGADPVAGDYRLLEEEVLRRDSSTAVPHLVVRTASAIAGPAPDGGHHTGLPHLLDSLGWLRAHVDARFGRYFQREPVRVLAPPGSRLDLVRAEPAAEFLAQLATGLAADERGYPGAVPAIPVDLDELLDNIGAAYELTLLRVSDPADLNAVDRLLQDRLAGFPALLYVGAGLVAGDFDGAAQRDFARKFRQAQHAQQERAGPEQVTVAVPAPATSGARTVEAVEPPLVIVNALGQGDGYWSRLLARMSPRRRVVLWAARGADEHGRVATFDDHLADLDALLRREGIETCHLLGWCTGAKTVLRHYHRRPQTVLSIVLLNPSFKHPDRAAELDTAYEGRLEALSAFLAERPDSAPRVLRMFSGEIFGTGTPDDQQDGSALATEVLALPDPALDAERRRPFASGENLVTYAAQLRDFWSHDVLCDAAEVRVPTLVIAGEHDRIVSGAALRAAVRCFPAARYEEIPGGTHYGMYEQPERLADLIDEFTGHAERR
jgi:pimeloyl-ACP methyl ester carboxylesterase